MTEVRAPYAGRTLPVGTAAERDLRDEISQLRVQLAELDAFNNDLLADVARLRAGIDGLRREHTSVEHYSVDDQEFWESPCAAVEDEGDECECGADEHNAALDALLAR